MSSFKEIVERIHELEREEGKTPQAVVASTRLYTDLKRNHHQVEVNSVYGYSLQHLSVLDKGEFYVAYTVDDENWVYPSGKQLKDFVDRAINGFLREEDTGESVELHLEFSLRTRDGDGFSHDGGVRIPKSAIEDDDTPDREQYIKEGTRVARLSALHDLADAVKEDTVFDLEEVLSFDGEEK